MYNCGGGTCLSPRDHPRCPRQCQGDMSRKMNIQRILRIQRIDGNNLSSVDLDTLAREVTKLEEAVRDDSCLTKEQPFPIT